MPKIEQCDRLRVEVGGKDQLDMRVMEDGRRLALAEHSDFETAPKESVDLLRTVMVAHLIAPFFPKIIETNFGVSERVFIDELYKYYGYQPPRIDLGEPVKKVVGTKTLESESKKKIKIASAHSGGLDSAYRLVKTIYEGEKVLAVHLRNLNRKNNKGESLASEEQCRVWGVPYERVRLINNTQNTGFETMRTRDFLLAVVTAITAYPYGSKKVLIEGGMFDDPSKGHFSENTDAWKMFNRLLTEVNLKVEVEGIDPGDVETVGEVIKLEKVTGLSIIPLIENCFSAPYQLPNSRRKWQRETPVIAANSSEHWCGSCLKCRRMTLGRLYYHDSRFLGVPESEIVYFKKDTYRWLKKYRHNEDVVSESFLSHLADI